MKSRDTTAEYVSKCAQYKTKLNSLTSTTTMSNAIPTNTPPVTPIDDDNEAFLAAARAQLEAAQARMVVWKAREAEEARQREIREQEAWEQLEQDIEEFLAGNRDWVAAEHVHWVEEVREVGSNNSRGSIAWLWFRSERDSPPDLGWTEGAERDFAGDPG